MHEISERSQTLERRNKPPVLPLVTGASGLARDSQHPQLRLPARQNHRRRVSYTAPRAYKPHARDGGTERRGMIVEEAASCRVESGDTTPPLDTPSSPHPHTHPPSSRFGTPLTRCLKIKNICTGLSQAHTYER